MVGSSSTARPMTGVAGFSAGWRPIFRSTRRAGDVAAARSAAGRRSSEGSALLRLAGRPDDERRSIGHLDAVLRDAAAGSATALAALDGGIGRWLGSSGSPGSSTSSTRGSSCSAGSSRTGPPVRRGYRGARDGAPGASGAPGARCGWFRRNPRLDAPLLMRGRARVRAAPRGSRGLGASAWRRGRAGECLTDDPSPRPARSLWERVLPLADWEAYGASAPGHDQRSRARAKRRSGLPSDGRPARPFELASHAGIRRGRVVA